MGAKALVVAAIAVLLTQSSPHVDVADRALQPGEMVVLTIFGTTTAAPHVRAFDRDLHPYSIGDGRWQVLVGLDLDVKPGPHDVRINEGSTHHTEVLQVQPKRFPTRRLTGDPNFVTPPPRAAERIEADARLLAATWASPAPTRLWNAPFTRPVKDAANSAFGTRSIFNGQPRNAHGGADFLSPAGTPIHAPNAGRVAIARDLYYSGNTVVLDHGLGLFSTFAHLSAFDVREGDLVERGQLLGRVGATGRVTGPHLHWAIRSDGARVDPLSLLAVLGEQ